MNSAAVDPKVEEQRMTDKQGETADAEVGDDFKYDQARVLSWVDPERVRRMMDGLTGLEVNEAIRDGRLREPTLSRVLGIRGRSGLAAPVRPRLGAQGPSRGAATHLTPFLRKCQILTDKLKSDAFSGFFCPRSCALAPFDGELRRGFWLKMRIFWL
jgi:hypothetical protein